LLPHPRLSQPRPISKPNSLLAGLALAALFGGAACDRVPEQALRDEQNRARKYRDAYENEHDENVALRAKLEQAGKDCPAAPAAAIGSPSAR
jgi:hypothetical protein